MDEKAAVRRELRSRPPVTPEESAAVCRHLSRWLEGRAPSRILVYLAMPGEVDLAPVVSSRHEWFVTRTPGGEKPLTVHSIDAPREVHPFGYEHPIAEAPRVDPATLDIVLTPSLSLDRNGHRIGWGKGYYDRLFAAARRAEAVGVTLERLLVDGLPVEPHDRRMDWLATDAGVRRVGA